MPEGSSIGPRKLYATRQKQFGRLARVLLKAIEAGRQPGGVLAAAWIDDAAISAEQRIVTSVFRILISAMLAALFRQGQANGNSNRCASARSCPQSASKVEPFVPLLKRLTWLRNSIAFSDQC